MLPELDKTKLVDRGPIKKMILLAKDYVHYLKKYSKAVTEGKDFDAVIRANDKDLPDAPKCSQLLHQLKEDLRCATTIFVEDFIAAGGIESLLEVLRVCQARQNDSKPARGRQHLTILRKISSNQYDCLLCLRHALQNPKSVSRVTEDAHGLSSIASCFMSSFPKSRILALQLLVRVLEVSSRGHALVLEALTAIRVVFGEAVRFKFLVGLIQGSVVSPPAFQTAALKFLNTLLKTSPRPADRIRLQCELEEAGLDISALETELRTRCIPCTDPVWTEIQTWRTTYLDMELVTGGKQNLESENERLQKEVQLLRQALKKLEEDKINLMQIEIELKEKCEDLNEEVTTLKTGMKKPKSFGDIITINDLNSHAFDDEDPFLSGDNGQLGTEEIFIDVPTIRPPVGFRSDEPDGQALRNKTCFSSSEVLKNCYQARPSPGFNFKDSNEPAKSSPNLSTKSSGSSSSEVLKKNSYHSSSGFCSKGSNSSDRDSALSESESDSGVNWSYPDLPQPASRLSRTLKRLSEDIRNESPLGFSAATLGRKTSQRSRSEDRRESRPQGVGEASNFTLKSHGFINNRESPRRDCLAPQHPAGRPILPSYQLPVAYRSNFLVRGHSNCDLYSGLTSDQLGDVPAIPPPDYTRGVSVAASGGTLSAMVHREITKAVKQISGWI